MMDVHVGKQIVSGPILDVISVILFLSFYRLPYHIKKILTRMGGLHLIPASL